MIPSRNAADVCQFHRSTRGPDWRDQLAKELSSKSARLPGGGSDSAVRNLKTYYRLIARQGLPAARAKFPAIAAAQNLERDPAHRGAARLMIMAGLASEEMSRRLRISVEAVRAWESAFFDVRDIRHSSVWLSFHVVRREREAGHTELAARLNLAVMAGPDAARLLLDCPSRSPVDEAERLAQRDLRLQLKLEQILEMPIGGEAANFRIVKLYGKLYVEKQRIALAREKLREKCTAARQRHELKMRRLELKLQEQRSAERQRSDARRRAAAAVDARRIERESAHKRRQADQMAREARAAQSPLVKLQWGEVADRDRPANPKPPTTKRIVPRRRLAATRLGRARPLAAACEHGMVHSRTREVRPCPKNRKRKLAAVARRKPSQPSSPSLGLDRPKSPR
jgi:hypothetical protein